MHTGMGPRVMPVSGRDVGKVQLRGARAGVALKGCGLWRLAVSAGCFGDILGLIRNILDPSLHCCII